MSDNAPLASLPAHTSTLEKIGIFAYAVIRVVIGLVCVAIIMSFAPDEPSKSAVYSIVMVIILIAVYGLYFWYQLRGVKRARFPALRAIEALILIAAMFLAVFSIAYLLVSRANPDAFTEPLTGFSSYYFSLTVLATVGFGDITPVTTGARSITMIQMALDLVFVAILLRVVMGTAKRVAESRKTPVPAGQDSPGA
jgi:hypothetical protein